MECFDIERFNKDFFYVIKFYFFIYRYCLMIIIKLIILVFDLFSV